MQKYNMRISLIFFWLTFSSVCVSQKEIRISLSVTNGISSELGSTLRPTLLVSSNAEQKILAKKLNLDTFITALYLHNPGQYYYNEYKAKRLNKESYQKLIAPYDYQTELSSTLTLDAETLLLIGIRDKNEIVIIADENNNNNLNDDRIRTLPDYQNNKYNSLRELPQVHIKTLQSLYKSKPKNFSQFLLLKPLVISANNFSVEVVHSQYYLGAFKSDQVNYTIGVRNLFPWAVFSKSYPVLKFTEKSSTEAFKGKFTKEDMYYEGDTLMLNQNWYTIKEVSPLMEYITLKHLTKEPYSYTIRRHKSESASHAANVNAGKAYPSFTINESNRSLVNKDFEGKVVFINFWFELCIPCIAEFDALNDLTQKLKDNEEFVFLAFTFEKPETIQKVKKQFGLQFESYSIPIEECEKLNFNNGYPTNIILDRKGVVKKIFVGGRTTKEGATKHIQEKILPEIMAELNKKQ